MFNTRVTQLGRSGSVPVPKRPDLTDVSHAGVLDYVEQSQNVFKYMDKLGLNISGKSKAKVEVNQGELAKLKKDAADLIKMRKELALYKATQPKPAADDDEDPK